MALGLCDTIFITTRLTRAILKTHVHGLVMRLSDVFFTVLNAIFITPGIDLVLGISQRQTNSNAAPGLSY